MKTLTKEQVLEIIKAGVDLGTLPHPNPYGDWISVKRHNVVMRRVEHEQKEKLEELLEG